jgi:hypothetical protein
VITAVDTNVLLDILLGDARFGAASRAAVRSAQQEGALVVGEVVWAEIITGYDHLDDARSVLDRLDIRFVPAGQAAAELAGSAWRAYRRRGGARRRIIADFLVGAHAASHADRLLTRDRGFYRSNFEQLVVIDPTDSYPPS